MFSVHVTLFTTDLVFFLFLVYLGPTWLFFRNTINIERPIAGGVQLWFRKDSWTLLRQITFPPVAVAVIIPLPLAVYLDSTRVKDAPLEHPPLEHV